MPTHAILEFYFWFFVSIYFGKRGRGNQHLLKKSMLRLMKTADREEFSELNKSEPGAVNHTAGLDGSEDEDEGLRRQNLCSGHFKEISS